MKIGGNFLEKYNFKNEASQGNSKTESLFGDIFLEKNVNISGSLANTNANENISNLKSKAQDSRDVKRKDKSRVLDKNEKDNNTTEDLDKSEKNKDTNKTDKVDKTKENEALESVDNEAIEEVKLDGIYEEIAGLLGISIQDLQRSLQELNIDPKSLLTLDGVRDAVMSLSGMTEVSELLNIEGIKDFFASVENIISLTDEEVTNFLAENPDFLANFEEAISKNDEVLENVVNNTTTTTATEGDEVVDTNQTQQALAQNQNTKVSTEGEAHTSNVMAQGAVADDVEQTQGNTNKVLQVMEEVNQEAINLEMSQNATTAQTQTQALGGQSSDSNSNSNGNNANTSNNNIMNNIMFGQDAKAQATTFNSIVNARMNQNPNIDTQDVINQIVEKMKFNITGDTSEVRITLRPEHLGDVTLKIATHNGVVTAEFLAESEQVRALIEANFQDLQETLRQKGLDVQQFTTSVMDGRADGETGRRNNENNNSQGNASFIEDEIEEVIEEEIQISNYDYRV